MQNRWRWALVLAMAGALSVGAAAQEQPGAGKKEAEKKEGMKAREAGSGMATGKRQAPLSPAGTAEWDVGGGQKVTVSYSRPSVRGRKVMGELVPFGKVWRTGANAATTLETPVDLMIGSTHVPKGKYTLFTLPDQKQWKLIISKATEMHGKPLWGTDYDESQDLARVDMTAEKIGAPVEQFTITFDNSGAKKGTLRLEWENTRLTVPVQVH